MELLIFVITIIMNFILSILTIRILKRNLLDFGGIQLAMFLLFYSLLAIDWILGGYFFDSSIMQKYEIYPTRTQMIRIFFYATLIMLLFYIGYSWGKFLTVKSFIGTSRPYKQSLYELKCDGKKYYIVQILMISIWAFLFSNEMVRHGHGLMQYIMPSRKSLNVSEFAGTIKNLIPILSWIMYLIKPKGSSRLSINSIYIFLNLINLLSGGQRRDVLAFVILATFVMMKLQADELGKSVGEILNNKSVRKKLTITGIFIISLIPLLWYARTIATNYTRAGVIVKAWEIRGLTELVFGSASTGFGTSLILDAYKEKLNIPMFHSLFMIVVCWIPRSLYSSKPMLLTAALKSYRNDVGNLSCFFVNDMIFSFDIFCILIVPILGIWMCRRYNKGLKSNARSYDLYISIYMFSNSILLFKNGFAQFMISYIIFCVTLKILCKLVFTECNNRIEC